MSSLEELKNIAATKEWIVSDEAFLFLEVTIGVTLHGVIAVIGVASNLLNMTIFWLLRLKDSMSVCLFVLSVTDFLVSCFQVGASLCYLLDKIYPDNSVNFWSLAYVIFGWARYAVYLISCWITTIISVERCFCVVSPFKVKLIFTKFRCIIVLVCVYFIHIIIILPIYVFERMEWVEREPRDINISRPTAVIFSAVFTQQTATIEIIIDLLGGMVLSIMSQSILIVCSLWMIKSLKATSSVRSNRINKQANSVTKSKRIRKNKTTKLSKHEKRLIRVVLFLAVLLTICNIPRLLVTTVHHTIPGLNRGEYANLDTTMWNIAEFFGTLCSACNILVYVLLNASFRLKLVEVFKFCTFKLK